MDLSFVPAIVRVLIVFALILTGIRFKIALGNAFCAGSVLLGLLFGMAPAPIARSALFSLLHPKTLSLAAVVCLILVLSHSMEAAGQMRRLLERFQGLVRHPGINLIVFPAIIGLLPMPGGAVFSAPMVKELGGGRGLSPQRLSFINYWFRHIWEYWWPLYPGVLLTTALAGIHLWRYVLFLFPLTLVAFAAGYWPLRAASGGVRPAAAERPPVGPFLVELTPVLGAIVLGLGLGSALSAWLSPRGVDVGKELGLVGALAAMILWVWRHNRLPVERRRAIVVQPELFRMMYMVVGILVFQGILDDSGAVEQISRDLLKMDISLAAVSVILPFLVGGVAGITIAFVGTTFPILISLVDAFGQGPWMMAYMMLATVSGFAGVLLSPLHLCLILSNGYFGADLQRVYRYLLPPCAA
ncbi:MAG: DUF401 family protein, partial [Desulfobacteraceae bacterium]|nr:DUF401 family protein [Desulfobacteraceae bacterium]